MRRRVRRRAPMHSKQENHAKEGRVLPAAPIIKSKKIGTWTNVSKIRSASNNPGAILSQMMVDRVAAEKGAAKHAHRVAMVADEVLVAAAHVVAVRVAA